MAKNDNYFLFENLNDNFFIVVNFKLGSGSSSFECVNADVDFNYLTQVDQQQSLT